MTHRKEGLTDVKKALADKARLLGNLGRISLTDKARIYVDNLKDGYAIKALEAQHKELLANYSEDKTAAFVKSMFNSSAPVSAYDSIMRAAPKSSSAEADALAAAVSLGFTLNRRRCACTKKSSPDYCIFRKLSFWENRKVQKELLSEGISLD